MQQTLAAVCVLVLVSQATAGVVPSASTRSTRRTALEASATIAHVAHALPLEHHDEHHEEPKPYKFGYGVKDSHHGLDFNQQEASDGHTVSGHYRVQLPDGRTQVVTYTADWKNGYNANVQYEGEASHPKVVASPAGHGWTGAGSSGLEAAGLELAGLSEHGAGGSSYSTGGGDHSKWSPSHA